MAIEAFFFFFFCIYAPTIKHILLFQFHGQKHKQSLKYCGIGVY